MGIVEEVAKTSRDLRNIRNNLRDQYDYSLRDLYRLAELPGNNPLKEAHKKLDDAVKVAYYYNTPKNLLDKV